MKARLLALFHYQCLDLGGKIIFHQVFGYLMITVGRDRKIHIELW